jgi:hypothetical protein
MYHAQLFQFCFPRQLPYHSMNATLHNHRLIANRICTGAGRRVRRGQRESRAGLPLSYRYGKARSIRIELLRQLSGLCSAKSVAILTYGWLVLISGRIVSWQRYWCPSYLEGSLE